MKIKHISVIFFLLITITSCEWTTRDRRRGEDYYDPYPVTNSASNTFLLDSSIYVFDYSVPGANGGSTNYYPNGQVKSEGNYNNGIPSGWWKFYYPDGRLEKEGNINNNQFSGYWKFYHTNGVLRAEGNFNHGFQSGYWKFYYPNGIMDAEGNFVNNRKNGEWKYYADNGRLYARIYHI